MPTFLGLSNDNWTAIGSIASACGTAATAIGVWVARATLKRSMRQNISDFEEHFWREYRRVIELLPVEALMGRPLSPDDLRKNLKWFYIYFDLTNTEIYLRMRGRISRDTWREWRIGIRDNFSKPAFRDAWELVRGEAESNALDELRKLVDNKFVDDPKDWNLSWIGRPFRKFRHSKR